MCIHSIGTTMASFLTRFLLRPRRAVAIQNKTVSIRATINFQLAYYQYIPDILAVGTVPGAEGIKHKSVQQQYRGTAVRLVFVYSVLIS